MRVTAKLVVASGDLAAMSTAGVGVAAAGAQQYYPVITQVAYTCV